MIFVSNFLRGIKVGVRCIKYALAHPVLLLLTAIPTLFTVIFLLTLLNFILNHGAPHFDFINKYVPHSFVGLLGLFAVISILNTFCTAALQHYTKQLLDNEKPSLKKSIGCVLSHIFSLALWGCVSFVVKRFTTRSSSNKQSITSQFLSSTLQTGWNITTLLVIPHIIFGDYTIFSGIGRSYTIVKSNISRHVGIYFAIAAIERFFRILTILLLIGCAYCVYYLTHDSSYLYHLNQHTTSLALACVVALPTLIIYPIKHAALNIFAVVLYNQAYHKNTGPFTSLLS